MNNWKFVLTITEWKFEVWCAQTNQNVGVWSSERLIVELKDIVVYISSGGIRTLSKGCTIVS